MTLGFFFVENQKFVENKIVNEVFFVIWRIYIYLNFHLRNMRHYFFQNYCIIKKTIYVPSTIR